MSTAKQAAYFGAKNAKYAMPDGAGWFGEPVNMPFLQSLALSTSITSATMYADDRKVIDIPVDKGYEGTCGLSVLDYAYEEALGYSKTLKDGSKAQLDAIQFIKHCLYFETRGARDDNTTFTIKAWMFNVTTAKSGQSYTTKGDNIEFGKHEMPIVVYGTTLLNDAGATYTDEDGNERVVFMVKSFPEDENYKTFGDSVPKPIYDGE